MAVWFAFWGLSKLTCWDRFQVVSRFIFWTGSSSCTCKPFLCRGISKSFLFAFFRRYFLCRWGQGSQDRTSFHMKWQGNFCGIGKRFCFWTYTCDRFRLLRKQLWLFCEREVDGFFWRPAPRDETIASWWVNLLRNIIMPF